MNACMQTHPATDSITIRAVRLSLTIACLCLPLSGYAATYYVGTCKPGKADFATIQEAVTTVPPGSIIDICPGNYPEWIYITQPLTLQGIPSGDSAAVTIMVPPGSPGKTMDLTPAQVLVVNPGGPVNLSGIVVDGTGFPNDLGYAAAGIFYLSASGTIDHVIVQNLDQNFSQPQIGPFQMNGIQVQDDFSVAPAVTIKNSIVSLPAYHPINQAGISAQSGSMTLNITSNSLLLTVPLGASVAATGIFDETRGTSTISNNRVSATFLGISLFGGTFSVTGNTIIGPEIGIWDSGTTSAAITGNDLFDLTGIISFDQNETIKNNQFNGLPIIPVYDFTQTTGIEFSCYAPVAIGGNTFVGLTRALQDVPSGISLQGTAGTYFGVQTIETICP